MGLKNCATAVRLCLTAFNENYTACLHLLHLWQYTLVMLYTKAQTPLFRFVVDLLQICL